MQHRAAERLNKREGGVGVERRGRRDGAERSHPVSEDICCAGIQHNQPADSQRYSCAVLVARVRACMHVFLSLPSQYLPTYHTERGGRKKKDKERLPSSLPPFLPSFLPSFLPLTAYNRLPFRKKFAIKEAAMSTCNKMQLVLRLLSFNRRIDMHAALCTALLCAVC